MLATLLALALAGCASRAGAPQGTTLVLAYGVSRDDTLTADLQDALRQRMGTLEQGFQALHPGVRIRVLALAEDRITDKLRQQQASGLAPDLINVDDTTALQLQRAGLLRQVRVPSSVVAPLDSAMVRLLRQPGGALLGLPLVLRPQLACYDRRRLERSPSTLAELLQAASGGLRVGLPLDPAALAWTSGANGALPALDAAAAGVPLDGAMRQQVQGWLTWLLAADLQQRVTFYASQEQVLQQLADGSLDWISCRSNQLLALRKVLGDRLGMAPLPDGPGGAASPLSRQRVLVFGRSSSPHQRRMAETLAAFVVSPLIQRSLTLTSLELMPANRQVTPPAAAGTPLAALLAAQAQADALPPDTWMSQLTPAQERRIKAVLVGLLFGELAPNQAADLVINALRGDR
ncbi:MAG: extracellular solute-binding protein [Cyanobacteriota bacterium]|nr:extracellular solute-binding protein [Cyanobacteriota bacterium]